jgi:branched-chain amino acid transport system permease protein
VTALRRWPARRAMVEMVYHLQLNSALGPELGFMGVRSTATNLNSWLGAGFVLVTGLGPV